MSQPQKKRSQYNQFVSEFAAKQRQAGVPFDLRAAANAWKASEQRAQYLIAHPQREPTNCKGLPQETCGTIKSTSGDFNCQWNVPTKGRFLKRTGKTTAVPKAHCRSPSMMPRGPQKPRQPTYPEAF